MTDPFSHQQQSHVYCAKNMDPTAHHLLMRDSLPPPRLPPPAVKWFKEWVPQETVSGAGNCSLLKWVTGDRPYTCPHEGCGKAFSLDFNLRAHMRTHSQENYHICPYGDCGKRYAHEYKLKAHIKSHHEKNLSTDVKHTPQAEKPHNTPKTPALVYGSASSDRPYSCPYEGCDKAYIHEYKLNLHLKREHPGHNSEENGKHNVDAENEADEGSDPDAYNALKSGNGKSSKRSKVKLASKAPAAKTTQRKGMGTVTLNTNPVAKPWTSKGFVDEEDSEETEEDRDNGEEEGWQYGEANEDDEETEYED